MDKTTQIKQCTIFCNGKINLSLNILGQKEDGYHYIDSIMQSIDLADKIKITKQKDNLVNIVFKEWVKGKAKSGGQIKKTINTIGKENTVKKVCDWVKKHKKDFGADIEVVKNLPIGGGLGGSSADAAGVLVGLDLLFGIFDSTKDLIKTSAIFGSDTKFAAEAFLSDLDTPFVARVGGTGEIVKPINSNARFFCLAVMKAGDSVSAGAAFQQFDKIYPSKNLILSDNDKLIELLMQSNSTRQQNNLDKILAQINNALFVPALSISDHISHTMDWLNKTNPLKTTMTGSGACCIGFYKDKKSLTKAYNFLKKIESLWVKII